MTKLVINTCYGGFGLSEKAEALYCAYAGITREDFSQHDIDRDSAILLQVIEQLGIDECHGKYAQLKVVDIPDDVEWEIEEYDGKEWACEVHRKWF
jgi:hypothetical protein